MRDRFYFAAKTPPKVCYSMMPTSDDQCLLIRSFLFSEHQPSLRDGFQIGTLVHSESFLPPINKSTSSLVVARRASSALSRNIMARCFSTSALVLALASSKLFCASPLASLASTIPQVVPTIPPTSASRTSDAASTCPGAVARTSPPDTPRSAAAPPPAHPPGNAGCRGPAVGRLVAPVARFSRHFITTQSSFASAASPSVFFGSVCRTAASEAATHRRQPRARPRRLLLLDDADHFRPGHLPEPLASSGRSPSAIRTG